MRVFFKVLVRALATPAELVRRGHLTYLGYLGLMGSLIGFVCTTAYHLIIEEISRLFSIGAIHYQQFDRMKIVVPLLVGILALPVVVAVVTLPVRNYRGTGRLALGALIRATPRATVRAGSAIVALAFHSFRLIIPLFIFGLGYIFALETVGSPAAPIGGAVVALVFVPAVWRFGAALVSPVVAVGTETSGRAAVTESKRRATPRLPHIWAVVTLGLALLALTLIGPEPLTLSVHTRVGISLSLVWYFLTVLADLLSDSIPPANAE